MVYIRVVFADGYVCQSFHLIKPRISEVTLDGAMHTTFAISGVPLEGAAVGTFVQGRPCIESIASAVMQQSLHLKKCGYVWRYHFSYLDSNFGRYFWSLFAGSTNTI